MMKMKKNKGKQRIKSLAWQIEKLYRWYRLYAKRHIRLTEQVIGGELLPC